MTFRVEKRPGTAKYPAVWMVYEGDRPLHRTLTRDEQEAHATAVEIAGCEECQAQYLRGKHGPKHKPSDRCLRGGWTSHCDCQACYG